MSRSATHQQLAETARTIELLAQTTATLQTPDGGFKGYYCHDEDSGIFTTAEIVHILKSDLPTWDLPWLNAAVAYLRSHQNADGGWPFRPGGKSISDATAWACLALSHFDHSDAIVAGVAFLMGARTNERGENQPGWGLTAYEPDRIYSTWIATTLVQLREARADWFGANEQAAIDAALMEVRQWLETTGRADGSWRGSGVTSLNRTNTALALLTLFALGVDPAEYAPSWAYLRSGLKGTHWNPERDLVITREGYEITQEWFTTAFCFEVLIRFVEAGVAKIGEAADIYAGLSQLIREDGRVTRLPGTSADFVWTIPFMLRAQAQYANLVRARENDFERHWQRRAQEEMLARKTKIHQVLRHEFPYPISRVFFAYQHELDHHRRFHLLMQAYEATIKYAATVGLAGYVFAKEGVDPVQALIEERFQRPSLGDWAALLSLLLKSSTGMSRLMAPEDPEVVAAANKPFLAEQGKRQTLGELLAEIVALRNAEVGHGAVRSHYEYRDLVESHQHGLYSLVERLRFLAAHNSFLILTADYDEFGEADHYTVRIFKGVDIDDGKFAFSSRLAKGHEESGIRYLYFQNTDNNTIVNLYPFISYMVCGECKSERFFFYNGLRPNGTVNYLSYDCGHSATSDNRDHFLKRLRSANINW
jgi:hypothetical protein